MLLPVPAGDVPRQPKTPSSATGGARHRCPPLPPDQLHNGPEALRCQSDSLTNATPTHSLITVKTIHEQSISTVEFPFHISIWVCRTERGHHSLFRHDTVETARVTVTFKPTQTPRISNSKSKGYFLQAP